MDDVTRSRIVSAANAAKDLIALYKREGSAIDARNEFGRERPQLHQWRSDQRPYNQGAALARELRRHLGLGNKPIASMRDLVAEKLPSLAVFYANLGAVCCAMSLQRCSE